MKAGIVLEDNCFKVSYFDKSGNPAVLYQNKYTDEYDSKLVVNGRLSYTCNYIKTVKLANPKLPIFNNIISQPEQKFISLNGQKWNYKQLMSILFKKVLHEVNSNVIDSIDSINLCVANDTNELLSKGLVESIKANDIKDVDISSYDSIIERYIKRHYADPSQVTIINLSDEYISYPGIDKENLNGFKLLKSHLSESISKYSNEINQSKVEDSNINNYLLEAEIHTIYNELLKETILDSYTILLKDVFFQYSVDMSEIYSVLDTILRPLTDDIAENKYGNVIFTGRYAKSNLIQKRIKELFLDLPKTEIEFDKTNEIKSKGILYN